MGDVHLLLDIVNNILPLGNKKWAVVAEPYNDYSFSRSRIRRDIDSLKGKFEKLSDIKKQTGDPSCPKNVQCAKQIARDIIRRVDVGTVGG